MELFYRDSHVVPTEEQYVLQLNFLYSPYYSLIHNYE